MRNSIRCNHLHRSSVRSYQSFEKARSAHTSQLLMSSRPDIPQPIRCEEVARDHLCGRSVERERDRVCIHRLADLNLAPQEAGHR